MTEDNNSLGKFHLDGIPPALRGLPQVEVTFLERICPGRVCLHSGNRPNTPGLLQRKRPSLTALISLVVESTV